MSLYRETMNSSTIEEKDTILVWNYVCVKSLDLRSTTTNRQEREDESLDLEGHEKVRGRDTID
jgi:hypothetical protein